MTARESRAAAAAAGAGGSAAANPIMQIRGGRGLGRGGGCALSGSGIWEKFTRAEGAGLPRAGGRTAPSWVKEAGRLGRGEEPRWGVLLLRRSHGHTFPGTRARTRAEVHPTPPIALSTHAPHHHPPNWQKQLRAHGGMLTC